MKHKHCELIKRWAEDTSLVRFYKGYDGCWEQSPILNWVHDTEYHLVCKKHAEVCLHWLNGGEVEILHDGEIWFPVTPPHFNPTSQYRIKEKWKPEVGELCHFYDRLAGSGNIYEGAIRKYIGEGRYELPFVDDLNLHWGYCEPLSAVGLKVI